jgi:hypothetical protein
MPEVKQYFSKDEFLKDLAKVTSNIDIEASAKLPHYCLQDTKGVQHSAPKLMVMIHLVNAIEDDKIIDATKSQAFRRRFMSICWKNELPTEDKPVEKVVTEEEVNKKPTKKTTKKTTKKVTKED